MLTTSIHARRPPPHIGKAEPQGLQQRNAASDENGFADQILAGDAEMHFARCQRGGDLGDDIS